MAADGKASSFSLTGLFLMSILSQYFCSTAVASNDIPSTITGTETWMGIHQSGDVTVALLN